MKNEQYFLSFDCATKTFAFILLKINFKYLFIDHMLLKEFLLFIIQSKTYEQHIDNINKLDNITKNAITCLKYDCVDLFPDKENKNIKTIERIKIMINYVKKNIFPCIINIEHDSLNIVIEFQMSFNTQSKIISIALITLFNDYKIYLVYPSLKNKIFFHNSLQHNLFLEKYTNYVANKKHTIENFKYFIKTHDITIFISDRKIGHIADAFMQVFGLIFHSIEFSISDN